MITYDDESLFLQDSVDKQISIISDDQTINITNSDIIGESMQIKESLSSGETLKFGNVESNCLTITVKNSVPRMIKKWITVTITPQGSEEPFTLGRYYVRYEKPSADRSTREVTAYDGLYKILTNGYKKWYNSLWTNTTTMTIKQFRDAWFERLHSTHSWLTQETTDLPCDGIVIRKSKKISRITGKDIFNAICEVNGVFGHIGRDNVFHYVRLNGETDPGTEIEKTYTISIDYEDFSTKKIDRVEVLSPTGEVLGAAGASEASSENKYVVQNNFLLKGLGRTNYSIESLTYIAYTIYNAVKDIAFVPFEGEFKGNPCYEVGDTVLLHSHNEEVKSIILNRTLNGAQSLHDVYSASNDETYPETPNTISGKIEDLKNQIETSKGNDINIIDSYEDLDSLNYDCMPGDLAVQKESVKIEKYTVDRNSIMYYGLDINNEGVTTYDPTYELKQMAFQWTKNGYNMNFSLLGYYYHPDLIGMWSHYGEIAYKVTGITKSGTYKIHCKMAYTADAENPDPNQYFMGIMIHQPFYKNDQRVGPPAGTFTAGTFNQYPGGGCLINMGTQQRVWEEYDGEFIVPDGWVEHGFFILWICKNRLSYLGGPGGGPSEGSGSLSIRELTIYHEDDIQSDFDISSMYVNIEKPNASSTPTRGLLRGATRDANDTTETEWKEIKFIHDAGDGIHLDDWKRACLNSDVMRAWLKANPPEDKQTYNRYCVRYTGDPDNSVTITYERAVGWENRQKVKPDKEGVYSFKCGGTVDTSVVQQVVYKIAGLTTGKRYYFNFKAGFNTNSYGKDYTKGLGLVFSSSNSINTNSWTGDPHTFNEETLYASFYRSSGGHFYAFDFEATASIMYMIVTVGDITNGTTCQFTIDYFVLSQTERKYVRSIYLFDTVSEEWLRYKPFGSGGGDGEASISTLAELDDVDLNNPSDGDALVWDAETGEWVNGDAGVSDYPDLTNKPSINSVTLSGNKTTRDLGMIEEITQAAYDLLPSADKNNPDKVYYIKDGGGSGGGGGGGSSTLAGLTDVDLSNPTDGQTLSYDATNQKWVNATPSGGSDQSYSTTERQVGTWIDGKPLYQITQVYDKTTITSSTLQFAHNVANIDQICGMECLYSFSGYLPDEKYMATLPWCYNENNSSVNTYYGGYRIGKDKIFVQIGSNLYRDTSEWTFTFKYTKTTDT